MERQAMKEKVMRTTVIGVLATIGFATIIIGTGVTLSVTLSVIAERTAPARRRKEAARQIAAIKAAEQWAIMQQHRIHDYWQGNAWLQTSEVAARAIVARQETPGWVVIHSPAGSDGWVDDDGAEAAPRSWYEDPMGYDIPI